MDTKIFSKIIDMGTWVSHRIRQRKTQTELVVFLLIILLATSWTGMQIVHLWKDRGSMVVYALDVGQGDSFLIRFPDATTMLIDGGPDDRVVEQLGNILPFWERHIDTVLLTHPQADHVGGLPAVLEHYTVGRVVMTGVLHTAPEYLHLLQMIRDTHISTVIVDHPFTETLPMRNRVSVTLEYLWPRERFVGKSVAELNNTSIIMRVAYGTTSFLFTGDSEAVVEDNLVRVHANLASTVLKVGHHGSDTSTSQTFLDAVQPQFAVISVGSKNKFGHPSRRILRRLERAGVETHRTDQGGRIRFVSDGARVMQW